MRLPTTSEETRSEAKAAAWPADSPDLAVRRYREMVLKLKEMRPVDSYCCVLVFLGKLCKKGFEAGRSNRNSWLECNDEL